MSACANRLSIKIDKSEYTAAKNGKVTVSGNVNGSGNLTVDGKKYKVTNGHFRFNYKLFNDAYDKTIKIKYTDPKNAENFVIKKLKIKANPSTVEEHKKWMDKVTKNMAQAGKNVTETETKEPDVGSTDLENEAPAETGVVTASPMKPKGYSFTVSGDQNTEGERILTNEEAGVYRLECINVETPWDPNTLDLGDFVVYLDIFPDQNEYDTGFDEDKALFVFDMTTRDILSAVQSGYPGTVVSQGTAKLSENNHIYVLNGTVKFTKI